MSDVLKLNDVRFVVGPNSISIQQENLSYRFHTLRENGGAKSSSGHGMAVIHMTIPIVKEDILSLHRLLIEVKRNPFVYIENKLIRQELVPHWQPTQNMAVTVTNLVIETTTKGPHRFNLNITAQWFNYKPYGDFLFRKDWKSEWRENSETKKFERVSINGIVVDVLDRKPDKEYDSFADLQKDWAGGFHPFLMPRIGMQASEAVNDPLDSRIYVRYHNLLQMEALMENFQINVINQLDFHNREMVLSGLYTLEEILRRTFLIESTVNQMLAHDYFVLSFNVYKMVDIPESLKKNLGSNLNDILEADSKIFGSVPTFSRTVPDQLDSSIAALLTQEIDGYDQLLNQASDELITYGSQLLYKMVKGETLSGTSYGGKKISFGSIYRGANDKTNAKNKNSDHRHNPSDAMDINYYEAPYRNHYTGEINGRDIVEDYAYHRSNGLQDETSYKERFINALKLRVFFIDLGYAAEETELKGKLLWGGGKNRASYGVVSGGVDYPPEQIVAIYKWMHGTRFDGINDPLCSNGAPFTFDDFFHRIQDDNGFQRLPGPDPTNSSRVDYKGIFEGGYGSDEVHIAITPKVKNEERFSKQQAPAVKSTVSLVDGAGRTVTKDWYEAIEALKEMTEADRAWLDGIRALRALGWTYYKENTTTGVFFKKLSITIPTTTGFLQKNLYDSNRNIGDAQNVAAGIYDGSPNDFDTILTNISFSLRHLISSIPILGSQYPTSQHMGSLDGTYSFEFATQDRAITLPQEFLATGFEPIKRDGMGPTAQLLKYALATCNENGRTIKNIYDSWMFEVDNFFTRFTGIKHSSEFEADQPHVHNPRMRKLVGNASVTQTLPHLAGVSSIVLECEESKPYIKEDLVNVNSFNKKAKTDIYKSIVSKMLNSSVSSSNNKALYSSLTGVAWDSAARMMGADTTVPTNDETVQSILQRVAGSMATAPPDQYTLIQNKDVNFLLGSTNQTVITTNAQEHFVFNGGITSYLEPSDDQVTTRLNEIGMATSDNVNAVKQFYRDTFREVLFGSYLLTEKELGGIDVSKQELYGLEKHLSPYLGHFAINALNTNSVVMFGWMFGSCLCFVEDLANELIEYEISILDILNAIFIGGPNQSLFRPPIQSELKLEEIVDDVIDQIPNLGDSLDGNIKPLLKAILYFIGLIGRAILRLGVFYFDFFVAYVYAIFQFLQEIGYYTLALAGLIPVHLAFNIFTDWLGYVTGTSGLMESLGLDSVYYRRPIFQATMAEAMIMALKLTTPFSETIDLYSTAVDSVGAIGKLLIGDNDFFTTQIGLLESFVSVYQSAFMNGSPVLYSEVTAPITQDYYEVNKLKSIKTSIEGKLSRCLEDTLLMKYFNIEAQAEAIRDKVMTDKKDCLPDLMLPRHPIYNLTSMTPPDFFYWNEQEDNHRVSISQGEKLYKPIMDRYVSKTHKFMEQMKNGDISKAALGLATETEMGLTQFDGSDNMAESEFLNDAKSKGYGFTGPDGQIDTLKAGDGTNEVGFENPMEGSPSLNPDATFEELYDKIKKTELQFGKREGFSEEDAKIDEFFANGQRSSNPQPKFDDKSLSDIAREAAKDIYSNKMRMMRAVPSFRLYLIEEDDGEDFLTKYDDFFSYDAVKEITIVRNREVAGDTAVIVLQNLAGTLDGNKRLSIRDVDYLNENRTATGAFTEMGSRIQEARRRENQNSSEEEIFTSVVLRPGSNMQIRMGYGNNAEALEVKLSGRVTDINKSVNGDLIEIIVQSFGVELEQQLKGLSIDGEDRIYDMTHKLLGSLMFEPELKHFGRWEKYIKTQYGESKDAEFDLANYGFSSYSPSSFFGAVLPHTTNALSLWYRNTWAFADDISNLKPVSALTNAMGAQLRFVSAAPTLVWDVVSAPVRALISAASILPDFVNKEISYNTAVVMAKPQDDNLFPPNPKDYLFKEKSWLRSWKDYLNNWRKKGAVYAELVSAYQDEIAGSLNGEKIHYEDLIYKLNNVTIWQVFKEMTLRHPGYVYAAVPYGKEFRYTMFFGLPSQRYWARPGSPLFIDTLNKVRTNDSVTSLLSNSYSAKPSVAWQIAMRSFFGSNHIDKTFTTTGDTKPKEKEAAYRDASNEPISGLDSLGIKTVGEALSYYMEALNYRFEPFRRYHLVSSGRDLSLNTLGLSNYNGANTMAVKYYEADGGDGVEDYLIVKAHDSIPDEDIKMKTIDFSQCQGKEMALRYGIGSLIYEMKQGYTGELLMLGDPRIKPWDIIILVDAYNDMVGPVEVEQVIERMSFETGYITEVKPNMVCFANEVSSFPILEGVKAIAASAVKQFRYFENFDVGNKGLEDIWKSVLDKEGGQLERWVSNLDPTGVSKATSEASQGIEMLKLFDIDLKGNPSAIKYIEYQAQKEIGFPTELLHLDNRLGSVVNSGMWLIGGYFYVMKASRQNPIIVYPLLKNGNPYVGVIPPGIPNTLFSIFQGNINTFLDDIKKGTNDMLAYWKLMGIESIDTAAQVAEAIASDVGGTR